MPGKIILGLNQYTHSAACCLLQPDGEVLFAALKERVTRKKHDGGDTAVLVEHALDATGLSADDLGLVVANNHLFQIGPFEATLPYQVALHQWAPSYLSPLNLLPGVPKHELSHHLAHAWSVLPTAPFDDGLIVVMDGMGTTLRDLRQAHSQYTTDDGLKCAPGFRQVPATPDSLWGYREAESAYEFSGLELQPVFKRYCRENTPDFLYNYGFENMESLGAIYSRVASHIFGDWNSCGKVMGLAPWNPANSNATPSSWLLKGPLAELQANRTYLAEAAHPNDWKNREMDDSYVRMASCVQADLETVVLDFLCRLREQTGQRNLALAGGVALNSTLNGRIVREADFEQVFVPSYPGDEGVAVGCAYFGLHHLQNVSSKPIRRPCSAYLGKQYSATEVEAALQEFSSYVEVINSADPIATAADALSRHQIVAWYQGRSEFGPRALGNRSILAHPEKRSTWDHVNSKVKRREAFRPFAPTILAEHASDYFEGAQASPFMSQTLPAVEAQTKNMQAVLHVDGTARIQTLRKEDNPPFHDLIRTFADRTGLPLVLNTSFNLRGEPIVETPEDALATFCDSAIDLLILNGVVIRKRPFPAAESYASVRPLHRKEVTADVTSNADGDPMQILLLGGGKTHEADELQLGIWEACRGESTLADLISEFRAEFEVEEKAFLEALKKLFEARLVRMNPV